jgi:preprotein translocase subunit Sec61beta
MLQKSIQSIVYSGFVTGIYFIAANIMYYVFNRQSMFRDIYFYEWVEYVVVAGILFVGVLLVEMTRKIFLARNV